MEKYKIDKNKLYEINEVTSLKIGPVDDQLSTEDRKQHTHEHKEEKDSDESNPEEECSDCEMSESDNVDESIGPRFKRTNDDLYQREKVLKRAEKMRQDLERKVQLRYNLQDIKK